MPNTPLHKACGSLGNGSLDEAKRAVAAGHTGFDVKNSVSIIIINY